MEVWLKEPLHFFVLLSLVNILFYTLTLLLSYLWNHYTKRRVKTRTVADFRLSLSILFFNIVIAIPGYLLFYFNIIVFKYEYIWVSIVIDVVIIGMVVDLIMYISHYFSHKIPWMKALHERHHTHHTFNELSLYVMHPLETIGLGMLFTLLFWLYDFNLYAVMLFLVFNWFWGVIAHFNVKRTERYRFFTNSVFHAIHHQEKRVNFGFYTTVWDRVCGTIKL